MICFSHLSLVLKYRIRVIILVLYLHSDAVISLINKQSTKVTSIKVDFDVPAKSFAQSWPEGIKFMKSYEVATNFPKFNTFFNTSDYPYLPPSSPFSSSWMQATRRVATPQKTYSWQGNDILTISIDLPELQENQQQFHRNTAIPTQWSPPLTWIKAASFSESCKFKIVVQQSKERIGERKMLEISLPKAIAESTIASLKSYGFEKRDIFRMLEKAPWILVINVNKILAKLVPDLCHCFDIPVPSSPSFGETGRSSNFEMFGVASVNQRNASDVLHLISHCPYLLLQHYNKPGKDYHYLYKSLLSLGYTPAALWKDMKLFPSLLTSSVERIQSWQKVFNWYYEVASTKSAEKRKTSRSFSSLLKRAPFLFYLDPPHLPFHGQLLEVASNFPHRIIANLEYLSSLKLPDLDKIIRTYPSILLQMPNELASRIAILADVIEQGKESVYVYGSSSSQTITMKNENIARFGRSKVVTSSMPLRTEREGRVQSEFRLAPLWLTYYHFYQKQEILRQEAEKASMVDTRLSSPIHYKTVDEVSASTLKKREVQQLLHGIVESNPAVLSFSHQKMIETMFFLEKYGFHAHDILKILKQCPALFQLTITNIQGNLFCLQQIFGINQRELIPLLVKHPSLLFEDSASLQVKADYFYEQCQSTAVKEVDGPLPPPPRLSLLKHPQYLLLSFEDCIYPRCEFLSALMRKRKSSSSTSFSFAALQHKIPALMQLLSSSTDSFCEAIRVNRQLFETFSEKLAKKRSHQETLKF